MSGRPTLAAAAVLLFACGSDAPPPPPQPTPRPAGQAPATNQGRPAAPARPAIDPAKAKVLAEVRKHGFKNEDFTESDNNRDPFRSFLADFSGGQVVTTQYTIKLPKYSLDELKLIAIIGPPTDYLRGRRVPARGEGRGYTQARAMFLDPQGTGQAIVRGDHFSKADAKVTRIDSEKGKIFLELKEDLGSNKTRLVERVLELHQNEPAEGEIP